MMPQTTTTPKRTSVAPVALGGAQDAAMHVVASVLGVYGGLLGLEHEYFETLQGNEAPGGVVMSAMGPPSPPSQPSRT